MSHNFLIFLTMFFLDYLTFFKLTINFHAIKIFLMQASLRMKVRIGNNIAFSPTFAN